MDGFTASRPYAFGTEAVTAEPQPFAASRARLCQ